MQLFSIYLSYYLSLKMEKFVVFGEYCEEAIIKKENEVNSLQQKYFGPEGSLNLKRQELITPIQDKIYDAIQQLASKSKYQIIFDSSSELIMLYKNNNLDKSDKVLQILGY